MMLGWLIKSFRGNGAIDSFHPGERLIYNYFDGRGMVRADPMVLYKRVKERGPSLAIDAKVAKSPSKDAAEHHGKLVVAIREVFHLAPFDQGGLTDLEATELLDHFLYYCDNVKKNLSRPATSPEATPGPIAPTSAVPSPIPSGSVSGSTAAGLPIDGPEKLPTGPP